jgi:small subunit ribosomal protein S9
MVTKEKKSEKSNPKAPKGARARYYEAVGRRKTAVARVRLSKANDNSYVVNERDLENYFPTESLEMTAREALGKSGGEKFSVSVKLSGGGQKAQAEAMRLGIARSLIKFDEELRGELKKAGFLKRDPRIVERKKFGLKKARKSPQWSKR